MHGSTDGPDGPAQGVEVLPGPLGSVHLVVELLGHNALRVRIIQVSQIDCRAAELMSVLMAFTFHEVTKAENTQYQLTVLMLHNNPPI